MQCIIASDSGHSVIETTSLQRTQQLLYKGPNIRPQNVLPDSFQCIVSLKRGVPLYKGQKQLTLYCSISVLYSEGPLHTDYKPVKEVGLGR